MSDNLLTGPGLQLLEFQNLHSLIQKRSYQALQKCNKNAENEIKSLKHAFYDKEKEIKTFEKSNFRIIAT